MADAGFTLRREAGMPSLARALRTGAAVTALNNFINVSVTPDEARRIAGMIDRQEDFDALIREVDDEAAQAKKLNQDTLAAAKSLELLNAAMDERLAKAKLVVRQKWVQLGWETLLVAVLLTGLAVWG